MAESLLDQDFAIRASLNYDDAIASVHTAPVAEGQTYIEGDLNVLRTLIKEGLGLANFYDLPSTTLNALAEKYVRGAEQPAGFFNVASGTGTSSLAWDTAIKTITGHSNGAGSSSAEGVVVDATFQHRLSVRNHDTNDAVSDGSGNEVYGRLAWTGTQYRIDWYSWVSGVETAYNFTASVNLDLVEVLVSRQWKDLPWGQPYHPTFHDSAGISGAVTDDSVVTNGFTDLLSGLTTQAQVNNKVDDLGSQSAGQGASLVALQDAAAFYTGTNLEAVLIELKDLIGSDTSAAHDFSEENVVADNDAVYAALEKLDLKWGDLASVATGEGAALVGVEDAGTYFTGTTVEAVLQEIGAALQAPETKIKFETTVVIPANTNFTLPSSLTYTQDAVHGANLDVFRNGRLLFPGTIGAGDDYEEVSTTQVKFQRPIPANRNLIFISRG